MPQLARRSSSSYKHVTNNNLVSKSPFKSQTPSSTSNISRRAAVLFPLSRKVSGEKRPRPASLHEQAENENERPFSLKRERKQSKGYQGLIQKEPVTKSPFLQRTPSAEEQSPSIPQPPTSLVHTVSRASTPSSAPSSTLLAPIANGSTSGVSPGRSSLVSKRMHGPRLSNGIKRERRKTVSFDERCDVIEFEREGETDEEVLLLDAEDDSDGYEDEQEQEPYYQEQYDPFFRGEESNTEELSNGQKDDSSHESLHLMHMSTDIDSSPALLGMAMDHDESISGLMDEMLASSGITTIEAPKHNIADLDTHNMTSTPPRLNDSRDFPVDLEMEGGIPLGRSHAARFLQRQPSQSPQQPPPHFSPHSHHRSPSQHVINLSTHGSPMGTPATPPRRSPAIAHSRVMTETMNSSAANPLHTNEHTLLDGPAHPSTPPLGRSTHSERLQRAREDDDGDVLMLPSTPSPSKSARKPVTLVEIGAEGLIPKFGIEFGHSSQ